MHEFIAWCGFIGAWLLFAGPLAQAARELSEEEFERERFEELKETVTPPPPISRWWLLVPPVYFLLRKRRDDTHHRLVADELSDDELEQLGHLRNVAAAWMYVALGASLIAVKETWELVEAYHWEEWVFWALVAVMVIACVGRTAARFGDRDPDSGAALQALPGRPATSSSPARRPGAGRRCRMPPS